MAKRKKGSNRIIWIMLVALVLLIVFAVGLFASILYLSTRGSYYDILQGDQRLTVPSKSTPKSSSTPAPSSNIQASKIQGGGKRGGGKPHPNLFCNLI